MIQSFGFFSTRLGNRGMKGIYSPFALREFESLLAHKSPSIMGFEDSLGKASIEEKKLLIKQCISRIVVDREKKVTRAYVRKIPAVTPELYEILQNGTAATDVVTAGSSGGRT